MVEYNYSAKRRVYPVIEDFFDRMLVEVDHAIDKYHENCAAMLPIDASVDVLKSEVREVALGVYDKDYQNAKQELAQVAGVCMMMYANIVAEENDNATD